MKKKIGKYVNTHGIKGEIRLISNFSNKDLVFVPNFKIYINDKEYTIESYRRHKEFDMLKLKGINSINNIEYLKNNDVFIELDDIKDTYIDLLDYKVVIENKEYKVVNIIDNYKQKIIVLDNNKMIPYVDEFIIKKDDINKVIYMNVLKDLM